jgi:DNA topoisomerase I
MNKNLVIVESPAKARTLSKILGDKYTIKASMGHVRDLPQSSLGIDVENGFIPKYVNIIQRKKVLKELKELINDSSSIYLATDPDREGEAISWHLLEAAKLTDSSKPIYRVSFHEITQEAVTDAFKHHRTIDMNLVNAQQARRLLDRLVGYKLSPLLWRKVQRGLSAGRVQSVTVRLIVDREREINSFVPNEYWIIEVELSKADSMKDNKHFKTQLIGLIDGKKTIVNNGKQASEIRSELETANYAVNSIQTKSQNRQPAPPFTTSTMQQEAARRLHFTAKRTMMIAQQLYEGIDIGEEGSVGLITYMRTDSTHVAASAISEVRDYITDKYGSDFLPPQVRVYDKKSKFSQEAHEAIRPTKIYREPDKIKKYLKPEQFRLYELIWKRMLASQMSNAVFDITSVEIEAKGSVKPFNRYLLKTSSTVLKFPGFITIYTEGKDDEDNNEKDTNLPSLKTGEPLKYIDISTTQKFTEPPPRYTEATLIKALEQKGIGRPSTYAPTISTIQDRDYVRKDKGRFVPNDIGIIVNDLLIQQFPNIVDFDFTAQMEKDLDDIADGKKQWTSTLEGFYKPFESSLEHAFKNVTRINTDKETNEKCPNCGKPMVIKQGRFGRFLACTGYPECKTTARLINKIGVPCPECGAKEKGELVERISPKKRKFYGCSRYPDCRFTMVQKPLPQPCPECKGLLVNTRGNAIKCISCDYKGTMDDLEQA